MTIQPENSNLNYLIDQTFTNINRLFVLSFARDNPGEKRDSHYCVPNARIKDFNILIDAKSFFDLPVKDEEKAYEKIIEISNNDGYFKENYKLIAIDLSKQTKLKDPQQINFIGKLEKQDHRATMFFIIEKSEETDFDFLQNSATFI